MPLLGLRITKGGVGNRYWFFQNDACPAVSLFTDDREVAAALQACDGYPEVAAQMSRWRKSSRGGLAAAGLIALALAGLAAGLWLGRNWMADQVLDKIPVSVEEKIGRLGLLQWEKTEGDSSSDAEAVRQLEALCRPLTAALPLNDYTFKFYLSNSEEVNAAALPGGYIVVNAGLVRAAATPEAIQGVLAHELGHVMKRHSLRQIIGQAGLWMTVGLALGDQSGWIGFASNNGALLLSRSFSRDCEREADAFAADLMIKARLNPDGMVEFFTALQKKEQENPKLAALAKTLSLGSTHPDTDGRLDAMRRSLPKAPPPEGWLDSAAAFQSLRLRLGAPPGKREGEDGEPLPEAAAAARPPSGGSR